MPIDILMPALSPTMEKGNLARWLKKEGDKVQPGDVLAEIETDKATMEVEATDEGVLAKILVPEGSTDVPVHQKIGLIAGEGEDPKAIVIGDQANVVPQSNPAANKEPAPEPASATPSPASLAGPIYAANGHIQPRLFASPLARRLAKDKGLDLATIPGSGPHGRIIKRDIEAALAKAPAPITETKAPLPPPPPSDEAIKQIFAPGSYEEIPHDLMRKTIAKRLVEASRTIPH
ncbi:MAG: E3 binding domain-containing protein, partial [Alphaproteobacteria bacterium]|nr:E3 binding domain-containing protein [Alphaproteobacteria bacterium]